MAKRKIKISPKKIRLLSGVSGAVLLLSGCLLHGLSNKKEKQGNDSYLSSQAQYLYLVDVEDNKSDICIEDLLGNYLFRRIIIC